jgi:hypothetical protein
MLLVSASETGLPARCAIAQLILTVAKRSWGGEGDYKQMLQCKYEYALRDTNFAMVIAPPNNQ